jgi:hypothetical protein
MDVGMGADIGMDLQQYSDASLPLPTQQSGVGLEDSNPLLTGPPDLTELTEEEYSALHSEVFTLYWEQQLEAESHQAWLRRKQRALQELSTLPPEASHMQVLEQMGRHQGESDYSEFASTDDEGSDAEAQRLAQRQAMVLAMVEEALSGEYAPPPGYAAVEPAATAAIAQYEGMRGHLASEVELDYDGDAEVDEVAPVSNERAGSSSQVEGEEEEEEEFSQSSCAGGGSESSTLPTDALEVGMAALSVLDRENDLD